MKKYRDNGAIGALLDEYEMAILTLKTLLSNISDDELILIVDPHTMDPNCHSIQTILTHVESACYGYIVEMRNSLGEAILRTKINHRTSVLEYTRSLDKAFKYNEAFFHDYPNIEIEQHNNSKKIKVSWGQKYDIEQLMEHAIVHILRHRRQIERFLLKIRSNKND